MHLFSSAIKQHKLKFTPLADCMQHLDIAAEWAEGEWGYIRNKGVEYRKGVLSNLKTQAYIGTLNAQPVALFVLFEKELSSELNVGKYKVPRVSELMYVYVDKPYRNLGFGVQIINEAKRQAKLVQSDFILLDTLKSGLNRFYEKNGAQVIAEGRLFSHPTDVLAIPLSSSLNDAKHVTSINIEAFQVKFNLALQLLKNKTDSLIRKGSVMFPDYNPNYCHVMNAAFHLMDSLESAKNLFFSTPITLTKFQHFKLTCDEAIKKAELEFKNHRGFWHQINPILKGILGLIAVITVFPALIVAATAKHGFINTFFVPTATDSLEQLHSFQSSLEHDAETLFAKTK